MTQILELIQTESVGVVEETLDFLLYECSIEDAPTAEEVEQWRDILNGRSNKFSLLAIVWFIAGIYSLIFKEAGNTPPQFPNFDKVAHFALFFAQIWLLEKSYIHEKAKIPYLGLLIFALLFATGSEWAQATFTTTREGSIGDGIADMLGTGAALWVASKIR